MSHIAFIKLTKLSFILISLVAMHDTCATETKNETIYTSRIKWNDENSKSELLKTIPQWSETTLNSLFTAYKNPEKYRLPRLSNIHRYNIQFINVFWGPLNNPFNKNPRPAKVFVFFDQPMQNVRQSLTKLKIFYMAPVIKNQNDGNYYVFSNSQSRPVILSEWINNLRQIHDFKTPVQFNICNGYGNFPADSCFNKSYQDEATDINSSSVNHSLTHRNSKLFYSAHRDIHKNWRNLIKFNNNSFNKMGTIYDSSIPWSDIPARNKLLNTVRTWPNYNIINESFTKMRDIRYFNDMEYPDFSRRISWLYPDDGCWTRAAAAIRDLFGPFNFSSNKIDNLSRPSKVFAFGNLCANTSNSPSHYVSWWYHTAPIIRDAATNVTYVLDPSINPYHPITMQQWVADISSRSGACSTSSSSVDIFNICTGYGSGPDDYCDSKFSNETDSMLSQPYFQEDERSRQMELGRDANGVLGNQPPWLD